MNYKETNIEQELKQYANLVKLNEGFKNLAMQAEVTGAIRSVSSIVDIVKQISDVAEVNKNSELIKAISSLNLELAKAQTELANALRSSVELEEENANLKGKIKRLSSPEWQLVFDIEVNAYYREDDAKKQIAYCPNCWDNKKEKYSLMKINRIGGFNMGYMCPKCKMTNDKID